MFRYFIAFCFALKIVSGILANSHHEHFRPKRNSEDQCGVCDSEITSRISGGVEMLSGEFPWLVWKKEYLRRRLILSTFQDSRNFSETNNRQKVINGLQLRRDTSCSE